MQLTYRGIRYTRQQPKLTTVPTEQTGTFLGKRYQMTSVQSAMPKRIGKSLSYRMIKYSV